MSTGGLLRVKNSYSPISILLSVIKRPGMGESEKTKPHELDQAVFE